MRPFAYRQRRTISRAQLPPIPSSIHGPHHFELVRRRQHPRRRVRTATSADLEIVTRSHERLLPMVLFPRGGRRRARDDAADHQLRGSAYPHGWPDYKGGDEPRPRGMGADRRHQLCRRRADDEADPAAGRGVDRLFRALFDGAAPRPRDPDRGARRASPTARSARASTARTSTA